MRNCLYLSMLLAGLTFTACASIPAYQASTSETARVRIALKKGNFPPLASGVVDIGEAFSSYLYDAGTCENQLSLDLLHSPTSKKKRAGALNMPLGEFAKNAVFETEMDANVEKRLTFQFGYLRGGPFAKIERCGISTDMEFQKGKDYEFVGVFDSAGICSVKFSELVTVEGQPKRRLIETFTQTSHPLPEACLVK